MRRGALLAATVALATAAFASASTERGSLHVRPFASGFSDPV
jgi:hypothetical protein